MTGAACLAAEAAFRADAGYVAVAVPEPSLPVVEAKLLEPVKLTWARCLAAAEKAGAIAIGPGLGRGTEAKALRDELLAAGDRAARARRRRAARARAGRVGRAGGADAARRRAGAAAGRGLRPG